MSTVQRHVDVLIVGAGPTGLTVAHELSRYGISYSIIDKKQGSSIHSKALALHARTLEIFQLMGVSNPIIEQGKKITTLFGYVNKRLKFRVSTKYIRSHYPYILALSQSDTELVLIDALLKYGKTVQRGVSLVSLEQQDSQILVTLSNEGGERYTLCANWVVGCDGAHSQVRHQLQIPFKGVPYAEEFILADAKLSWDLSTKDAANLCFSSEGELILIPIGDQVYRIITRREQSSSQKIRLPELAKRLKALAPSPIEIRTLQWLANFRIHRRIVSTMHMGRVFLAGDAAHIHSPIGGQGMNIGIHDGFNLAWKLALRIKGYVKDDFLGSYHDERYPIAEQILKATNQANKVVFPHNSLLLLLRNTLLPLLFNIRSFQSFLINSVAEIGMRYRNSSIIDYQGKLKGYRHPQLLPGQRVPDLTLILPKKLQKTSLYQILGFTHHLLLFIDPRIENQDSVINYYKLIEHLVDRYKPLLRGHCIVPIDSQQHLPEQALAHYLFKTHSRPSRLFYQDYVSLYCIRPDGYLAYQASPPNQEHLVKFLDRIFDK